MYLSNRDAKWAVVCGKLIVNPPPEDFAGGYDETSIDLHLDALEQHAKVWDIEKFKKAVQARGGRRHAELHLGSFTWTAIANEYLMEVPNEMPPSVGQQPTPQQLVFRRGDEVVVRPFGFLLWTTKEEVGTPVTNPAVLLAEQRHPELICFVNAKSTKARTGLLVHFTAPTINAGWVGKITLEIANLGPFDFVLCEGDAIAQLTVATISSAQIFCCGKANRKPNLRLIQPVILVPFYRPCRERHRPFPNS